MADAQFAPEVTVPVVPLTAAAPAEAPPAATPSSELIQVFLKWRCVV